MAQHYDTVAIQNLEQRFRANLINSLSGAKSANLVGSVGTNGVNNLCIVSSAFHVGANPPLMGILMRPHTVVRDTLQNIKDTGCFTINHVHQGIVEQAHQCSARYEPDQSEFEAVGLTPEFGSVVKAPYVGESHIKLGLEVREIQVLKLNATELVIAEIVEINTRQDYLTEDGYVDIEEAGSVCVSGLDSYHQIARIDRYSYAKPDTSPHSIWKKTR